MAAPKLVRGTCRGVTLLGDSTCPGGVTFAFTERSGGVSKGSFSSLNLGSTCGDDVHAVAENRLRMLDALNIRHLSDRLVCPNQVHGDNVAVISRSGLSPHEAQRYVLQGVDAIVCLERDVPVLLCAADCVLVVLVSEGAFAVIHSGWRGSLARIAGKTLRQMVEVSGCEVAKVRAYVGPHIGVSEYEVSLELAGKFVAEFGTAVVSGKRNLDLGEAVVAALIDEGMERSCICQVAESTASHTDRFFSYRKANGVCGRHGAVACMPTPPKDVEAGVSQKMGEWDS